VRATITHFIRFHLRQQSGSQPGSTPVAEAGQSQPCKTCGNQPQQQGYGTTHNSIASAGATFGNCQI
jgi:hypothetical protein